MHPVRSFLRPATPLVAAATALAACGDAVNLPTSTPSAGSPQSIAAHPRKGPVSADEFISAYEPGAGAPRSALRAAGGARLSVAGLPNEAAASASGALAAWEPTLGTNLNLGDDYCRAVPLGFAFSFYGRSYTNVYVSSNGHAALDACSWDYDGNLPSGSSALIAPASADWVPSRGDPENVYYTVVGEAPRRRFVATWRDVHMYRSPYDSRTSFQFQLLEWNGAIQFGYDRIDEARPPLPRVGISSGTGSYVRTAEGAELLALSGSAICYTPDGSGGYVVTRAACGAAPVAETHPPVAAAGGPYTAAEGSPVTFDASASTGPGEGPLTFDWRFGDGADAPGATPVHRYADNGSFAARVAVSDGAGRADTASAAVTVTNVAPTATLVAQPVDEGTPIALALVDAHDPSPADAAAGFAHAFDCGGGAGLGAFAAAAGATCLTTDDGAHAVRGAIRDKDGGATEYAAHVAVRNVAPEVAVGLGGTILSGERYTLRGAFRDRGVHDMPWTYTVDFGGAAAPVSARTNDPGEGVVVEHRFLRAGRYTVTLSVTDKDGGTGRATTQLVVERAAVPVDVRPASVRLNDRSGGTLPVVVLSTAAVDATTLDVGSVRLERTAVARRSGGTYMAAVDDVNGDGRPDLVLHFDRAALEGDGDAGVGTTTLVLTADLADGRQVEGRDTVQVKP